MSSDIGAGHGASPGMPQQPRWAWWVVGIVIPVAGIIVSILVSGAGGAGSRGAAGQPPAAGGSTAAQATTAASSPAPGASAAPAARVRYGPVVFQADMSHGGPAVELDSSGPVVADDIKGADLRIGATTGAPDLGTPDSANTLAPLPASSSAPTEAQCAEAVRSNGTYTAEAPAGSRFCLTTGEGRTAYLKVITATPGAVGATVKFEVTVWDTPAA
ncbi:hypothetical protein ABT173_03995 [Streptomyces sp. NPDC001795]|uniref:hypothetical protein n=1 Tax=unclassified Streptomyces TaxID=2593676 RepID=UPI00332BD46F